MVKCPYIRSSTVPYKNNDALYLYTQDLPNLGRFKSHNCIKSVRDLLQRKWYKLSIHFLSGCENFNSLNTLGTMKICSRQG